MTSPTGGVTEAISDGRTGFVLSARESLRWVDRVIYLQDNPKTVVAVQRAARAWTEDEFDVRRTATRLLAAFGAQSEEST